MWVKVEDSGGKWLKTPYSQRKTEVIAVLIGEYSHTVDAKGRVFLPVKYREDLGEKIYITNGLASCLFVFSEKEWLDFIGKLKALPMVEAGDAPRYFVRSAKEVTPDAQGRILIPASLRQFAGLEKDVVITGVLNRAEIWAKDNWDRVCANITTEKVAEILNRLGF